MSERNGRRKEKEREVRENEWESDWIGSGSQR